MKKLIPSALLALFSFATVLTAGDNALSKSEKADGWKLLFNGKDLTDWKVDKWNPDSISVKDGAIKCHGKPSMVYYTERQGHEGFSLQGRRDDQAGIKRRNLFPHQVSGQGWPVGHEAQINQTQRDPVKTGSVYIVKKNLKDNEWFHYEIIVQGNRVETKGRQVRGGLRGRQGYRKRKPQREPSAFRPMIPGIVLVKNKVKSSRKTSAGSLLQGLDVLDASIDRPFYG